MPIRLYNGSLEARMRAYRRQLNQQASLDRKQSLRTKSIRTQEHREAAIASLINKIDQLRKLSM